VRHIFEGLKVADFSWVATGPQVTRALAQQGAVVVKVESHKYPDPLRTFYPFKDNIPAIDRSAFFAAYNPDKYSISLDLNKLQGQQVAKKLVTWADIVIENMSPGTMARWGLDYESCKQLKPDIIYISTTQMGQSGPYSLFAGYGQFAAAMAGFFHLTGWSYRDPSMIYNNYPDFIAPHFITITLVGALLYRHRTGKGMYIEQSQIEAAIYFLGPALLDYFVNGREANRQGNRDPYMVPHGIFPCQGEDEWVAIAVSTNEEWQNLCRALGREDWLQDERFATILARKENEGELEELISNWTKEHTPEEVMDILQSAGVAAGVVATSEDLFNDPQLKHRGHFKTLEHRVIGRHSYQAPAFRFSKTPHYMKRAGPTLGEDNEYVYKEILGFTDEEIAELLIEGVITTDADVPEILKGKK